MFKKAIPFVLVSGLALTACANNNDNVPNNNETPMENLERDLTPNVNNGAGPDMDGIDNGLDGNNNGGNNGILNDDRNNGIINDRDRNNGDMNGDNTTAPNNDIITDDNTTTPNDTDTNRNRNKNNNNNR
ncbi:hypothetical protein [Sporosarcina koreensis]|uniref:hypothetical protein n=1 Tax=Bacillales TaxID=1385 RepID=UPI000756425D|nr:hypothetical protein [Sporosarcina koreensis]